MHKPVYKQRLKKGAVIGRKKILRAYDKGPFTYVDTQCLCAAGTVTRNTPFGQLRKGIGLQCRVCLWSDIKEAQLKALKDIREAKSRALKAVMKAREEMRESVRENWGKK